MEQLLVREPKIKREDSWEGGEAGESSLRTLTNFDGVGVNASLDL